MEAYSLDLRERICAACDEGLETRQEVADRFGVGRWFVQKLLRQRRKEGSIAPKARGRGPAPTISPADRVRLKKLVKEDADARLSELCHALHQAGGAEVHVWTMCRALKAMRLALKKRRCTPASGIRRGFARYAGTSRNAWRHWTRRNWSSWTKAESIRR
jgi:transposase